jgi:hypothetical protein
MKMIYRVSKKTTNSLQPGCYSNSFWNTEVAYCGNNLEDARIEYLRHLPSESFCGYGNRCTHVSIEQFESDPEDIDDFTSEDVEEFDFTSEDVEEFDFTSKEFN